MSKYKLLEVIESIEFQKLPEKVKLLYVHIALKSNNGIMENTNDLMARYGYNRHQLDMLIDRGFVKNMGIGIYIQSAKML